MKITRYAHATMLVEVDGARILIDPADMGMPDWTDLSKLDGVIITHDHFDHINIEGLKKLLGVNPELQICADVSASKLLTEAGLKHQTLNPGDKLEIAGVAVEANGGQHAHVHPTLPPMANIGIMIADRFYFPGDSYDLPDRPVDVLALPTSGPWAKLEETIDFLIAVKPKSTFPTHDGLHSVPAAFHPRIEQFAKQHAIEYLELAPGDSHEF